MLGVLGLAAVLHPLTIDAQSRESIVLMIAMVGVLVLFMRSGWRLSRLEGLVLIAMALFRWQQDLSQGL